MKRILLSILIVLLYTTSSSAAIGAATVWEIRQDATAGNVNGGGFDSGVANPGTDYSQQAAAEDYGTDLACADGDAATPSITSATHNFVEADEGNVIHITAGAGWTAGWYTITDTSANAAILDRACGSDGALTSGTWYLGGAMSLNSTLDDEFFETVVAGNTVFIKYNASAISTGEIVTISTGVGTASLPIKVIGYDTTRTVGNTDTNRPTLSVGSTNFSFGSFTNLRNLIWTGSGTAAVSYGKVVENCKFTNSSGSAGRYAYQLSGIAINCEFTSPAGIAVNMVGAGSALIGCYIHDSDTGIRVGASNMDIVNTIVDTVITLGINIAATYDTISVLNNTIYAAASPAGSSIGIDGNDSEGTRIMGNIIMNFVQGIQFSQSSSSCLIDYNNFYGNTTDRDADTLAGAHDIDADPQFTNAPDGDFRVGANMKAGAYPGVFPGGLSTGYMDIGAVQRIEPAASSGGGAWGF